MCVCLALPQVVNIVSNDVRRFDDALPFYNFLICSPGERVCAQDRVRVCAGPCNRAGISGVFVSDHTALLINSHPRNFVCASSNQTLLQWSWSLCLCWWAPSWATGPAWLAAPHRWRSFPHRCGMWGGYVFPQALMEAARWCWGSHSCGGDTAAAAAPNSTAPGRQLSRERTPVPSRASLLLPPHPQAMLVRYIGRLRASTAAQTDERVRLTGEVISGVLATKMLGEGLTGGALDFLFRVERACCAYCLRQVAAARRIRLRLQLRLSTFLSAPRPCVAARLGGPLFAPGGRHPAARGALHPAGRPHPRLQHGPLLCHHPAGAWVFSGVCFAVLGKWEPCGVTAGKRGLSFAITPLVCANCQCRFGGIGGRPLISARW